MDVPPPTFDLSFVALNYQCWCGVDKYKFLPDFIPSHLTDPYLRFSQIPGETPIASNIQIAYKGTYLICHI